MFENVVIVTFSCLGGVFVVCIYSCSCEKLKIAILLLILRNYFKSEHFIKMLVTVLEK